MSQEKTEAARLPADAAKAAALEALGKKYGAPAPTERPKAATVTIQATVPPIRREPEKTKPNRPENEFMMNLMILRNSLAKFSPACRERAKRAGKWIWRDIRLMTTLVDRVQDAMLGTMPPERDEYYRAYAVGGHYELVMNGPKRQARFVLIQDKHLGYLMEAAMEAECVMCFREGSEIGKCPLRAALLECAPPTELQEWLWTKCEYREAASAILKGEEVNI